MKKLDELSDPNSCLNKARDDEQLFVLIGRDPAMSQTLRYWAHKRIQLGKNKQDDQQIQEALALADKDLAALRPRLQDLEQRVVSYHAEYNELIRSNKEKFGVDRVLLWSEEDRKRREAIGRLLGEIRVSQYQLKRVVAVAETTIEYGKLSNRELREKAGGALVDVERKYSSEYEEWLAVDMLFDRMRDEGLFDPGYEETKTRKANALRDVANCVRKIVVRGHAELVDAIYMLGKIEILEDKELP
jgi:hypothetical protein